MAEFETECPHCGSALLVQGEGVAWNCPLCGKTFTVSQQSAAAPAMGDFNAANNEVCRNTALDIILDIKNIILSVLLFILLAGAVYLVGWLHLWGSIFSGMMCFLFSAVASLVYGGLAGWGLWLTFSVMKKDNAAARFCAVAACILMCIIANYSDWVWTVYYYAERFTLHPFEYFSEFCNRDIKIFPFKNPFRLPGWLWVISYLVQSLAISAGVFLGFWGSRGSNYFCKKCRRWNSSKTSSPALSFDDPAAVAAALQNGDFTPLFQAAPAEEHTPYYVVSVCNCQKCNDGMLSISKIQMRKDRDGKINENSQIFVDSVFCPGEVVTALFALWQQSEAAPADDSEIQ